MICVPAEQDLQLHSKCTILYLMKMNMKKLIAIAALLACPLSLTAARFTLLESDSLDIPVARYRTVRFEVAEEMSLEASLTGSLDITPDTSSVELILLHIDDYQRWTEEQAGVDTLGYLETGPGQFRMPVPGLGRFALVVSNRGNYSRLSVVMDLDLQYTGTDPGDPLPAALKFALLLIALGAAAFAIGSVIVKMTRRPGKQD